MTERALASLGLTRAEAQTWPRTYSVVGCRSFFAQQTNNRASASWKKAEYIAVAEDISEITFIKLRHIWKSLFWVDQYLIISVEGTHRMLDGRGNLITSGDVSDISDCIEGIMQRRLQ